MNKLNNLSLTLPTREDLVETINYVISWSRDRKYSVLGGLGLVIFTFAVKAYGPDFRHRYFAFLMNWMRQDRNEEIEAHKKSLFEPLASMESSFPEMRAKKGLKILEVGVGSGANFEHYPDNTHLIVVDPNPHFQKYYEKNCKKYPNIDSEDIIIGKGESMPMVADSSVDAVVVTMVLCSATSEEKFMKEVYRVLTPGGKFFFLEHVKEWDWRRHPIRWFLQVVLTVLHIWPTLFDGCHLTRNSLKHIHAAGFSSVSYKCYYAPIPPIHIFYLIGPHLQGMATK